MLRLFEALQVPPPGYFSFNSLMGCWEFQFHYFDWAV